MNYMVCILQKIRMLKYIITFTCGTAFIHEDINKIIEQNKNFGNIRTSLFIIYVPISFLGDWLSLYELK